MATISARTACLAKSQDFISGRNTLKPSQSACKTRLVEGGSRRPLRIRSILGGGDKGGESKNPFANFTDILKNATEAQAKASLEASKVQEELSWMLFEGYDADEKVKVVVSGNQEPRSVEISEDAMAEGADKLSELIVEAMKDAHRQSTQGMKDRMMKLYADLGIPVPNQNAQ